MLEALTPPDRTSRIKMYENNARSLLQNSLKAYCEKETIKAQIPPQQSHKRGTMFFDTVCFR